MAVLLVLNGRTAFLCFSILLSLRHTHTHSLSIFLSPSPNALPLSVTLWPRPVIFSLSLCLSFSQVVSTEFADMGFAVDVGAALPDTRRGRPARRVGGPPRGIRSNTTPPHPDAYWHRTADGCVYIN